jgi:Uma2 family endonuclease
MSRLPPLRTRRFTRVEYDRLVRQGFFDDERLELLNGLLAVKEPQSGRHAGTVVKVRHALERAFGRRYHCRAHAPVALDPLSEPEPDVAVVRGPVTAKHPARPVLVVEVSDSSLARDRVLKRALYARAALREYWVVNLAQDVVEVYRQPLKVRARGWTYRSVRIVRRGATVTPLAAPRARIRVAELFV